MKWLEPKYAITFSTRNAYCSGLKSKLIEMKLQIAQLVELNSMMTVLPNTLKEVVALEI